MKLTKVLIPSLSVASIASIVAPATASCACSFLRSIPQNLFKIDSVVRPAETIVYLYGFIDNINPTQLKSYQVFTMPDCVHKVESMAFYDGENEKSLIPDNIKELNFNVHFLDTHSKFQEIESYAFKRAPFERIVFPFMGTRDNKLSLCERCFDRCDNLKLIDFSNLAYWDQVYGGSQGCNPFASTGNNKGTIIIPPIPSDVTEKAWIYGWTQTLSNDLQLTIDDDHWTLQIKK